MKRELTRLYQRQEESARLLDSQLVPEVREAVAFVRQEEYTRIQKLYQRERLRFALTYSAFCGVLVWLIFVLSGVSLLSALALIAAIASCVMAITKWQEWHENR